jgi:transposase
LTFYEWFRSYNAYARSAGEIRTQLFQRQLAPSVLSIASSVAESERERIHTNLMRLREVYQDLNTLINQGVLKPIPVVSNREIPSKYVFQKLSRALGDEEILVDSSYSGEPWDLLAGERVRVYRKNQVYQLSWIGLIKHQLNSEARNRNSALPARAEVMLLERIAQRVFEQQRQATTAMSYLRSIIEEPIAGVAGKDPVQIEVLVEEVASLSGGKKWAWLAQNALVNVVPRVLAPGVAQTASELMILSQTSQDLLDAATGRNSTYWRQPEAILTSALEHEVTKIHVEQ